MGVAVQQTIPTHAAVPAGTTGIRGSGFTPVSITATSTPFPVEHCAALPMLSIANPGEVTATLGLATVIAWAEMLLWRIGLSGPGRPSGGTAEGSTDGAGVAGDTGRLQLIATNRVATSAPIRCMWPGAGHRIRTQLNSPLIQAASGIDATIAVSSSDPVTIRTIGVNLVTGTRSAANRPQCGERHQARRSPQQR